MRDRPDGLFRSAMLEASFCAWVMRDFDSRIFFLTKKFLEPVSRSSPCSLSFTNSDSAPTVRVPHKPSSWLASSLHQNKKAPFGDLLILVGNIDVKWNTMAESLVLMYRKMKVLGFVYDGLNVIPPTDINETF